MGWIGFALWLLLTPVWIAYWLSAAPWSKMAFVPPALVLIALALRWLWQHFVVLVAGEAEPSPRRRIQELTADWRAERDLVFRPKRTLRPLWSHPIWGLALPSRGTMRLALIAAAAGACIGAAAMLDRSSFSPAIAINNGASRLADRSDSPVSVRTEVVKSPSFSAAPDAQNNSPTTSTENDPPLQRPVAQGASTTGQSSSDQAGCDVSLCERRYRSFRASDCTYQPYGGSRQYCGR